MYRRSLVNASVAVLHYLYTEGQEVYTEDHEANCSLFKLNPGMHFATPFFIDHVECLG